MQHLSVATVSSIFTLLEKYGLSTSPSSANILAKSLKMSCNKIRTMEEKDEKFRHTPETGKKKEEFTVFK